MSPVVAITTDQDPCAATTAALELASDSIVSSLEEWVSRGGDRTILIKPNLLSTEINHACNTRVEACDAVARFFKDLGSFKIVVAEGTTWGKGGRVSTTRAFENHGYRGGPWDLVDLHEEGAGAWFEIANYETEPNKPIELGIAKSVVNAFTVSVAKFKTHDVLGLTLSMKNMMGALVAARFKGETNLFATGDVKGFMHGFGNKKPHELQAGQNTGPSKVALAANIIRILRCKAPDLAVIDGSTVMEGQGPRRGTACGSLGGLALASTDCVAIDATCAAIASMPLESFQYVARAGHAGIGTADLDQVSFKGVPWRTLQHTVAPHPAFATASPWTREELALLDSLA